MSSIQGTPAFIRPYKISQTKPKDLRGLGLCPRDWKKTKEGGGDSGSPKRRGLEGLRSLGGVLDVADAEEGGNPNRGEVGTILRPVI